MSVVEQRVDLSVILTSEFFRSTNIKFVISKASRAASMVLINVFLSEMKTLLENSKWLMKGQFF